MALISILLGASGLSIGVRSAAEAVSFYRDFGWGDIPVALVTGFALGMAVAVASAVLLVAGVLLALGLDIFA